MRQGRFYVASALALSLFSLSGCAADGTSGSDESDDKPVVGDWGDESKYPEIGGAFHTLTALAITPVFATGTLTITSNTAEVIVVGKRSIDSAILVNGTATGATATTMKKLVITGGANDQTVILDFLGGVFGAGTTSARGIDINLGAGTNTLGVRGSSAGDTFAVGTDGVSFNADNYRDIDVNFANVSQVSFALAAGNDSFVATAAGKGVAGTATKNLTVYGGDGNDTITGGDGNDALFGGAGNDVLFGGGVTGGYNTLSGELGADTINQGVDANGADRIHCGTEAMPDPDAPVVDTVSYKDRGTAAVRDGYGLTLAAAQAQALATDGESVNVTVGGTTCSGQTKAANANGCAGCTDVLPAGSPDGNCDALDAFGLAEYPADDGDETETSNAQVNNVLSPVVKGVTENDAIAADCEAVVGGSDNDTLTGDATGNTLSGGAGDDTFVGNAGDDVLNGDVGDDLFNESTTVVGAGADEFNGGAGTDTVTYASRSTALTVTMDGAAADDGEGGSTEGDNVKADIENLIGGTVADTITGNNNANAITGGNGNDILSGGTGDDVFEEGSSANGGDVFNGGAGLDTVNYRNRTGALTVTMDGLAPNDGEGGATENDDIKADVENCNGGAGADNITGNDLVNVLNGGAGVDKLYGLGGDDTLDGETDGAGTAAGEVDGGTGDDICLGAVMPTYYANCELYSR